MLSGASRCRSTRRREMSETEKNGPSLAINKCAQVELQGSQFELKILGNRLQKTAINDFGVTSSKVFFS